ncbi:hypothetical protein A8B73_11890 [Methylosinus sp. 3S-1]|nr:hypothetical protein A8B73_11890 [Methylosinus sp. 3S-1]
MTTRRSPRGWHCRGYLPHFETPERAQHVVFRVAGPLPKFVSTCSNDAERMRRFEEWLDSSADDGAPLLQPDNAHLVSASLRAFDGERYDLHAWCVMPNHVHALATFREGTRLGDVVKSWKIFTARRIVRADGDAGAFWARDYFDRYMRSARDFESTVGYIENNPVVAGLVSRPEDWPWSSAAQSRG